MRPVQKFLLLASTLVPAFAATAAWFARNYWGPDWQSDPSWPSHATFWGGANLAEVYSHWLNLWACSGVHAAFLYLLVAERIARRREIGWKGTWALRAGIPFAAANWLVAVVLDGMHGEGAVIACIPLFFLPLMLMTALPFVVLAGRLPSATMLAIAAAALAACMVGAQLLFEPSSTGAPNVLILHAMGAATVASALPTAIVVRGIRRELVRKGFDWATWSDAAFVAINVPRLACILDRDELAVLPGYVEGNIRSVCELATLRER